MEVTLENSDKYDSLKQVKNITGLADICYVRQKDQRGLSDAISCAEKHIGDEAFAVLLCDSITKGSKHCTKQLMDVYEKYDSSAISLEVVPEAKIDCYEIINGTQIETNVYKLFN